MLRFGLDGHQPRTLEQIGKQFGLSRERVRQIERETMAKLRDPQRADALRDYLAYQRTTRARPREGAGSRRRQTGYACGAGRGRRARWAGPPRGAAGDHQRPAAVPRVGRADDHRLQASAGAPRAGRRPAGPPGAAGPPARQVDRLRAPVAVQQRPGARRPHQLGGVEVGQRQGAVRAVAEQSVATPPSPKLTSAPKDGSSTISHRGHAGAAISCTITGSPDGMAANAAHRLGVDQVEPDAAQVGAVPQPRRRRLQDDGVADPRPPRRPPLRVGHRPRAPAAGRRRRRAAPSARRR